MSGENEEQVPNGLRERSLSTPQNPRHAELCDELRNASQAATPGLLRTPRERSRLHQLVSHHERRAKVLNSEKLALQQELEMANDRVRKLEASVKAAEGQRDMAQRQLQDTEQKAADAGEPHTEAELQTQLGEANSLIHKLETENAKLAAQVEAIGQAFIQTMSVSELSELTTRSPMECVQSFLEEYEAQRQLRMNLQLELDRSSAVVEACKAKIAQDRDMLAQLDEQAEELEKENDTLRQRVKQLQTQATQAHEAAKSLQADKRELLAELNAERDNYTTLRHRMEELAQGRGGVAAAAAAADSAGATSSLRSLASRRARRTSGLFSSSEAAGQDAESGEESDPMDLVDELQLQLQNAEAEQARMREHMAAELEDYHKHVALLSEMLADERTASSQLRKDLQSLEMAYQTEIEQTKLELDDYRDALEVTTAELNQAVAKAETTQLEFESTITGVQERLLLDEGARVSSEAHVSRASLPESPLGSAAASSPTHHLVDSPPAAASSASTDKPEGTAHNSHHAQQHNHHHNHHQQQQQQRQEEQVEEEQREGRASVGGDLQGAVGENASRTEGVCDDGDGIGTTAPGNPRTPPRHGTSSPGVTVGSPWKEVPDTESLFATVDEWRERKNQRLQSARHELRRVRKQLVETETHLTRLRARTHTAPQHTVNSPPPHSADSQGHSARTSPLHQTQSSQWMQHGQGHQQDGDSKGCQRPSSPRTRHSLPVLTEVLGSDALRVLRSARTSRSNSTALDEHGTARSPVLRDEVVADLMKNYETDITGAAGKLNRLQRAIASKKRELAELSASVAVARDRLHSTPSSMSTTTTNSGTATAEAAPADVGSPALNGSGSSRGSNAPQMMPARRPHSTGSTSSQHGAATDAEAAAPFTRHGSSVACHSTRSDNGGGDGDTAASTSVDTLIGKLNHAKQTLQHYEEISWALVNHRPLSRLIRPQRTQEEESGRKEASRGQREQEQEQQEQGEQEEQQAQQEHELKRQQWQKTRRPNENRDIGATSSQAQCRDMAGGSWGANGGAGGSTSAGTSRRTWVAPPELLQLQDWALNYIPAGNSTSTGSSKHSSARPRTATPAFANLFSTTSPRVVAGRCLHALGSLVPGTAVGDLAEAGLDAVLEAALVSARTQSQELGAALSTTHTYRRAVVALTSMWLIGLFLSTLLGSDSALSWVWTLACGALAAWWLLTELLRHWRHTEQSKQPAHVTQAGTLTICSARPSPVAPCDSELLRCHLFDATDASSLGYVQVEAADGCKGHSSGAASHPKAPSKRLVRQLTSPATRQSFFQTATAAATTAAAGAAPAATRVVRAVLADVPPPVAQHQGARAQTPTSPALPLAVTVVQHADRRHLLDVLLLRVSQPSQDGVQLSLPPLSAHYGTERVLSRDTVSAMAGMLRVSLVSAVHNCVRKAWRWRRSGASNNSNSANNRDGSNSNKASKKLSKGHQARDRGKKGRRKRQAQKEGVPSLVFARSVAQFQGDPLHALSRTVHALLDGALFESTPRHSPGSTRVASLHVYTRVGKSDPLHFTGPIPLLRRATRTPQFLRYLMLASDASSAADRALRMCCDGVHTLYPSEDEPVDLTLHVIAPLTSVAPEAAGGDSDSDSETACLWQSQDADLYVHDSCNGSPSVCICAIDSTVVACACAGAVHHASRQLQAAVDTATTAAHDLAGADAVTSPSTAGGEHAANKHSKKKR